VSPGARIDAAYDLTSRVASLLGVAIIRKRVSKEDLAEMIRKTEAALEHLRTIGGTNG
jgi:hypothetical protein